MILFDEWMYLKKEIIKNLNISKEGLLFNFVEYNLLNYCNRSCEFCPVKTPDKKQEMPFNLFKKSIDELKSLGFKGLIGFSGFCEPTLHPQISNFLLYIKEQLPEVVVAVNSNGDIPLSVNNLDYLIVSAYDESTYEKTIKRNSPKIIIRKRFEEGMIKNNRAGSLYTASKVGACYYPFYMLYIDWNGDVLFCSHNFNKERILGNIEKDSLSDIWRGKEIAHIREEQRKEAPCLNCDVIGTLMGKEDYDWYKKCKN